MKCNRCPRLATLGFKTCEACRAYVRNYYHRPEQNAKARKRYKANAPNRRTYLRYYSLINIHGITPEVWMEKFSNQGNSCALCFTKDPGGNGWQTDHDHECCPGKKRCGKCFRGVLCYRCNTMLGLAKDSVQTLRTAIEYITRNRGLLQQAESNINALDGKLPICSDF